MKLNRFEHFNEGKKWTEADREHIDVNPDEDSITCEPSEMYCPYCGSEQAYAHPSEVMDDGYGEYECEVCEEIFSVEQIYHLNCSKIK